MNFQFRFYYFSIFFLFAVSLQQSEANHINERKFTSDCSNGKAIQCINQTHFQYCSSEGNEGSGGSIESCADGQLCDEQSETHCATVRNRRYSIDPHVDAIRLIKGKRASNWRPRLPSNTARQRYEVANYRDRWNPHRREQEYLIDSIPEEKKNKKSRKDVLSRSNAHHPRLRSPPRESPSFVDRFGRRHKKLKKIPPTNDSDDDDEISSDKNDAEKVPVQSSAQTHHDYHGNKTPTPPKQEEEVIDKLLWYLHDVTRYHLIFLLGELGQCGTFYYCWV